MKHHLDGYHILDAPFLFGLLEKLKYAQHPKAEHEVRGTAFRVEDNPIRKNPGKKGGGGEREGMKKALTKKVWGGGEYCRIELADGADTAKREETRMAEMHAPCKNVLIIFVFAIGGEAGCHRALSVPGIE
ncbi:unnamed protein product [Zymoseptoria tritici ST99CH_1E4]|uniref:Uncharacterized protein n=1 Tax=Zymoseptoria tritici ST99CH_1E4 TaxID=1276532 RepID=A0A2H1HA37_ZYMTR|nr:unnamed protein product [Zymoseptoria tritici ST99CH_1E4]